MNLNNNQTCGTDTLLSKFAAFTLVCSPILGIYGWESLTFSFLCNLLCVFFYYMKFSYKKHISKQTTHFITYCIILALLYLPFGFSFIPFGILLFLLNLNMLIESTSLEYVIKIYRLVFVVSLCVFIVQEISYSIVGIRISGLIPYLPVALNVDMEEYSMLTAYMNRSSSLFSEPAHFAQFLLPLLCLELFWNKDKWCKLYAGLIVVVLLLIKSGNAIIGLIAVLTIYLLKILQEDKHRSLKVLFFVTVVIGTVSWFVSTDAFVTISDRFTAVDLKDLQDNNDYGRLFRGYEVYGGYNVLAKFFGIYNPIIILDIEKAMKLSMDGTFYYNGIQCILLESGIIGFFFFCKSIKWYYTNGAFIVKSLMTLLVVISLAASTLFGSMMMLCFFVAEKTIASSLYNNSKLKTILC